MYPITKVEADALMSVEKYIETEISWNEDPNKENIYEFRVPVKIYSYPSIKLILKGSTNVALQRHSFSIIYNGSARIKALDIGKTHKNKCPTSIKEKQLV